MKNYVAYFAQENEFKYFNTHEEAEEWLMGLYDDSYPEETIKGLDFIAKVTHRSKFTETDNKRNYEYEDEDDIPEGDEESEAWPYDSDVDSVGVVTFEKINEKEEEIS